MLVLYVGSDGSMLKRQEYNVTDYKKCDQHFHQHAEK